MSVVPGRWYPVSRLWFRYLEGSELEDTVSSEYLTAMLEGLAMIRLNESRTEYEELPRFKRYHRRFWLLAKFEKLKRRYEYISPIY